MVTLVRHAKRLQQKPETLAILAGLNTKIGLSTNGRYAIASFIGAVRTLIVEEAIRLAHVNGRTTISARDIQSAVRLVLPGELAKLAVSEGTKAVTAFNARA
jgi:histone H2B